jgi:aspartate/tyrosine/aromatic aminotransferase
LFQTLESLPPDAILGLIAEHKADPRDNKIDLGVGVYMTPAGKTPVLDVVKEAEQYLVETQDTKAYVGTAGDPSFNSAMQKLTFGDAAVDERLVTIEGPGGSGCLRVAAGLIMRSKPDAKVWVGDPTWANHIPLLGGAGLALNTHPYYDIDKNVIRIDELLEALRGANKGDIALVHACCHNPTGMDPTEDQWRQIAEVIVERELIPFIDMAYQGFANDLHQDAFIVRHLAEQVPELIVSNSCSKNFGLYRERVGSLSVLCENQATRDIVRSNLDNIVRTIYSMPPDHGAAIVSRILNNDELDARWQAEVGEMRRRMREMRALLQTALAEKAPDHDFSHLTRAAGMFTFLGISKEQVATLKKDYAIYMVGSSRINVAGITEDNVEYLAASIATVL